MDRIWLRKQKTIEVSLLAGRHVLQFLLALIFIFGAGFLWKALWHDLEAAALQTNDVVKNMFIRDVSIRDGHVQGKVYGDKVRSECVFLANATSALVWSGSHRTEAKVTFVDDMTPGSNRPPGKQDFGTWRFTAPNIDIREVSVIVAHLCPGVDAPVTTTFAMNLKDGV